MTSTNRRSFGEVTFGHIQLGDQRRTRRLVTTVDRIMKHPGGTLPAKLKSPMDLKALYRLCDCKQVTHAALMHAARQRTLERISEHQGVVLVLHDATELDYTWHHSLKDQLGQIGDGGGRGYICHNSLAVDPNTREAIGLVGQILHHRADVVQETPREHRERGIAREPIVGPGDRTSAARSEDRRCVRPAAPIRSSFWNTNYTAAARSWCVRHKNRMMLVGHGRARKKQLLHDWMRTRQSVGTRTVTIHGRYGQPPRIATVQISCAPLRLLPPQVHSGEHGNDPLPVWCVAALEIDPPAGQEPVEWFQLTNIPTDSFEDATVVLRYYECRWVVEELHKAKKTGCGIENMQFTKIERLEPMIAVLSVVAVALLNLRDASRQPDAKTRPATDLFHIDYVRLLSAWRSKRVKDDWSVQQFFLALARLGGHQNRSHDHLPGWLVLWRGWTQLQAMLDGAQAAELINKCGQT